jgi:hypothetical protein
MVFSAQMLARKEEKQYKVRRAGVNGSSPVWSPRLPVGYDFKNRPGKVICRAVSDSSQDQFHMH